MQHIYIRIEPEESPPVRFLKLAESSLWTHHIGQISHWRSEQWEIPSILVLLLWLCKYHRFLVQIPSINGKKHQNWFTLIYHQCWCFFNSDQPTKLVAFSQTFPHRTIFFPKNRLQSKPKSPNQAQGGLTRENIVIYRLYLYIYNIIIKRHVDTRIYTCICMSMYICTLQCVSIYILQIYKIYVFTYIYIYQINI